MTIALPGDGEKLTPSIKQSEQHAPIEMLTAAQVREIAPLLRPESTEAATFAAGVADVEVATLHQAYLRAITHEGGHC